MQNIYISSSWKNRERVRALANLLKQAGPHVYDFTDPTCRKSPEIPPEAFQTQYQVGGEQTYEQYLKATPSWKEAVFCNKQALDNCDICVLLLPCGADAHADWAYAVGKGKLTCVVGCPKQGERTPSHMWCDAFFEQDEQFVVWCIDQNNI